MICPKCGAEYVPGIAICSDCDVDLVEAPPGPVAETAEPAPAGGPQSEPQGEFALVTVFATSDPGLAAIAETMLQSAGIPVIVEGGSHHWGGGPLGMHVPTGPSTFRVAPRDVGEAREILAGLQG